MNKTIKTAEELKDALEHGGRLVVVKEEDLEKISGGATVISYEFMQGIAVSIAKALNLPL